MANTILSLVAVIMDWPFLWVAAGWVVLSLLESLIWRNTRSLGVNFIGNIVAGLAAYFVFDVIVLLLKLIF